MKTPPLRKTNCDDEGDAGKRGIIGRRAGKASLFVISGGIDQIAGSGAKVQPDFCTFHMVAKTLTICLRGPGVIDTICKDRFEGAGQANHEDHEADKGGAN